MVDNVATYGHNPDPQLNGGLGALYINWRFGTKVANLAGPDSLDAPGAHDPLTDLRYLHDLLLLRAEGSSSDVVGAEIARYTPIVKTEFRSPHDQRGWIFDELIDMARLSGDDAFRQAALSQASYIDTAEFHAGSGAIYAVSNTYPQGTYRTDLAISDASALIEAGKEFSQPQWIADGRQALDFVYGHAYLAQQKTLIMGLYNVVNADGSINPNELVIHNKYRNELIDGGAIKLAEVGQIAISLLHASAATGDAALRQRAIDYLRPFTMDSNALGLWDAANLGYFAEVTFSGKSVADPGTPTVITRYKESGRQALMLQAFHLADRLSNGQAGFQGMEAAMLQVLVDKAYYAPGHGVLYEMSPDWQPVKPALTWVTSEAIGITMEALLSIPRAQPW